jgi:hypothetical protein
VLLGFEQANKYTVYNQDGEVVALLAEDLGGLGRAIGRQLLRTRRSFVATVMDPEGTHPVCGFLTSNPTSSFLSVTALHHTWQLALIAQMACCCAANWGQHTYPHVV